MNREDQKRFGWYEICAECHKPIGHTLDILQGDVPTCPDHPEGLIDCEPAFIGDLEPVPWMACPGTTQGQYDHAAGYPD